MDTEDYGLIKWNLQDISSIDNVVAGKESGVIKVAGIPSGIVACLGGLPANHTTEDVVAFLLDRKLYCEARSRGGFCKYGMLATLAKDAQEHSDKIIIGGTYYSEGILKRVFKIEYFYFKNGLNAYTLH